MQAILVSIVEGSARPGADINYLSINSSALSKQQRAGMVTKEFFSGHRCRSKTYYCGSNFHVGAVLPLRVVVLGNDKQVGQSVKEG